VSQEGRNDDEARPQYSVRESQAKRYSARTDMFSRRGLLFTHVFMIASRAVRSVLLTFRLYSSVWTCEDLSRFESNYMTVKLVTKL
jgi:hypothetical protein